jgi:hypothetical protein
MDAWKLGSAGSPNRDWTAKRTTRSATQLLHLIALAAWQWTSHPLQEREDPGLNPTRV